MELEENTNQENLYEKIQELLGNLKGNLNILEEQIDIDTQMAYFDTSKELKKSVDRVDTLNTRHDLFSNHTTIDDKKSLLVKLATIDHVDAFRTLEEYRQNPDPELKDWATLAMQESRMLLESTFLDENQVFISTGLGGKGQKLRYFIVFLTKDEHIFEEYQKKVIQNEILYNFKKYDAEVEEIQFSEAFCTIKAIIPIQVPLNLIFENAINECNQFGDFLQMNFIVTNVKDLTFDEINDILKNSHQSDEDEEIDDEYLPD